MKVLSAWHYSTHSCFLLLHSDSRYCVISYIYMLEMLLFYFPVLRLIGLDLILISLNHTCRAGMPRMQAPSVLHSCSHTRAAPGAQRVDSQMGPAPEPRLKGHPLSMTGEWKADSSLPALTERWRASSAGLKGKYNMGMCVKTLEH